MRSGVQGASDFPYERLVYPQLAAGERRSARSRRSISSRWRTSRASEPRGARLPAANDGRFADYRAALAGTVFLDRFERFLEQYGHRGQYESDWSLPRLHENPAPALFAIRAHLEGPPQDTAAAAARQDAEAAAAWREFESRLTWWQRSRCCRACAGCCAG